MSVGHEADDDDGNICGAKTLRVRAFSFCLPPFDTSIYRYNVIIIILHRVPWPHSGQTFRLIFFVKFF